MLQTKSQSFRQGLRGWWIKAPFPDKSPDKIGAGPMNPRYIPDKSGQAGQAGTTSGLASMRDLIVDVRINETLSMHSQPPKSPTPLAPLVRGE